MGEFGAAWRGLGGFGWFAFPPSAYGISPRRGEKMGGGRLLPRKGGENGSKRLLPRKGGENEEWAVALPEGGEIWGVNGSWLLCLTVIYVDAATGLRRRLL